MSWIEIRHGPEAAPRKVELGDGLVVGGSRECDLVLEDPSVSAKHAWIRLVGGRYVVIDLRSTNGVTLNGHPVREAILHDGDELTFGDVSAVYRNPHEGRQVTSGAPAALACPRCGNPFVTWGTHCPTCGLKLEVPATGERHRAVVRLLSSLAFAGGLSGPLLLGIGWMLGIVLGVMVLSGYREESEERDLTMARRGILLGLLWLTLLVCGVSWWLR